MKKCIEEIWSVGSRLLDEPRPCGHWADAGPGGNYCFKHAKLRTLHQKGLPEFCTHESMVRFARFIGLYRSRAECRYPKAA